MPQIKWIGIQKGQSYTSRYQKGPLAKNAKKIKTPQDLGKLQLRAIPFVVIAIIILMLSMRLKAEPPIQFLPIILGLVVGFLVLTPIHELLHAIVYPRNVTVYIGCAPKSLAFVALASYPLKRPRFILMCLLPYILGIIPLALFLILPFDPFLHFFLFGLACMGLCLPCVDAYIAFAALRQSPKHCQLQFHGDDLYFIPKKP